MPGIIPAPVKCTRNPGTVDITSDTRIVAGKELQQAGMFLKNLLDPAFDFNIAIEEDATPQPGPGKIVFVLDETLDTRGNIAYSLNVNQDEGIIITARSTEGAFYGVQTLRQLLPPSIEEASARPRDEEWKVPCIHIEDWPRFTWRGFMLDVGRHFVDKETIKKIIDVMACLKMNVFHWHLTEDQGWRIEIKNFPKLVEIGSKRKSTQVGGHISPKMSGNRHEGHYTQDDAREIVVYASERFITVIPEIEMPGHCKAMLAAYPELSCMGGPFEVATKFGIIMDVLCLGKDTTFDFVEKILDEVLELFPSKVIHIGGDETPRARWRKCPDCQRRIKTENLKNVHALQTYFTNRISKYLESKGRTTMGWNEVLAADLAPGAVVQFWTGGTKQIVPNAAKGRKFVMSAFFHIYLDHDYVLLPLSTVYDYDPLPRGLPEQYNENILGIEVPLWTEWVRDEHRLYWQLFPRLLAAAEVGWTSKENKNFKDFKQRVPQFCERLTRKGMKFAPLNKTSRSKLRAPLSIFHMLLEPRIPKTY